MSDQTQDLLLAYAEARWTQELQEEVMVSLSVFEVFQYHEHGMLLDNILLDTSDAFITEDQRDMAIQDVLLHALDDLLKAHQIEVFEETPLEIRNELCAALYRIQFYEDAALICRLLNSGCPPEERMARTLALISKYTEEELLPHLENVPEETVKTFQSYFETRESSEALTQTIERQQENRVLRENLASYIEYTGAETMVAQMLESGFEPGYPISLYYPYVKDVLVTPDDTETAQNLLGLFYFSMDTYTSPTEAFKRYSDGLFEGTQRVIKVESLIREQVTKFNHYRKAQDDARRVSSV